MFWRVGAIALISICAIAVIVQTVTNSWIYTSNSSARPTPVPITLYCFDYTHVQNWVIDRFLLEVPLLDSNDFAVTNSYTGRPVGSHYSEQYKAETQVLSITFRAQKPGTGKYVEGLYQVHLIDETCRILTTHLDW